MEKTSAKVLVVGVLPKSLLNFRGELIQAIKAQNKSVLTISTPLSDDESKNFKAKGIDHCAVNFQRNGLNPWVDLMSCWALYRLYKKEQPEKVLAYTIKPVIWGGIAARMAKVPFYALITGLGFAFQGETFKRKLLTKLVSFLYKVGLSGSRKVIFQNEDNRRLFVDRGIVTFSKTEVVNGSGVDIYRFGLAALPGFEQGVHFLCIARLLGEKGLREYAQAASIVKAQYPNAMFVLVGPEDTSPDGILVSEVSTWKDINFVGAANDVRPFIERAHVYVLPSYHEGLPRSTIEAMAMGRAVITTDAVGCKETVENGLNGFKVPVADAQALAEKMIWFIENAHQIEPMGLASRKMAEDKFDVHKVNARMLEIMGI
ncbi:MAG: glycosyltransferase family 4 protein [Moraxella osloensis]|nr:glycosyltransferase family 4 protein [Moraxella osloensis]MBD3768255.1 glycosyltransferase family 4 protein [Gammaproteobacteria bacterium]